MTMASPLPPFIAATTQRRRQLLLQHRLDEAANAVAQTGLDRVEPSVTRKQPLGARRCRAILVHGVVSPGASTPGFGCRVSTGDYVTPFPTTSRTGPDGVALELTPTSSFETVTAAPRIRIRTLLGTLVGLKRLLGHLLCLALALEVFAMIGPLFL